LQGDQVAHRVVTWLVSAAGLDVARTVTIAAARPTLSGSISRRSSDATENVCATSLIEPDLDPGATQGGGDSLGSLGVF
jgi:hypothetical protein